MEISAAMTKMRSAVPRISTVYYFRAPTKSFFNPVCVGKNTLYVEIMVGGTVFYEGNKYTRGTVFCHKHRDQTIHDFPKGRPYRVLMLLFENYRHGKWNLPHIGTWRHLDSLDSFVHDTLEDFNREAADRELLSEYLFSTLRLNLKNPGEAEKELPLAKEIFIVRNKLEQMDPAIDWRKFAAHAGYSPSYLRNFFTEQFQIPPGRYRLQHRLKAACKLLEETDLPVRKIAEKTCFQHQETFYRAFKRNLVLTPAEYRNSRKTTISES